MQTKTTMSHQLYSKTDTQKEFAYKKQNIKHIQVKHFVKYISMLTVIEQYYALAIVPIQHNKNISWTLGLET